MARNGRRRRGNKPPQNPTPRTRCAFRDCFSSSRLLFCFRVLSTFGFSPCVFPLLFCLPRLGFVGPRGVESYDRGECRFWPNTLAFCAFCFYSSYVLLFYLCIATCYILSVFSRLTTLYEGRFLFGQTDPFEDEFASQVLFSSSSRCFYPIYPKYMANQYQTGRLPSRVPCPPPPPPPPLGLLPALPISAPSRPLRSVPTPPPSPPTAALAPAPSPSKSTKKSFSHHDLPYTCAFPPQPLYCPLCGCLLPCVTFLAQRLWCLLPAGGCCHDDSSSNHDGYIAGPTTALPGPVCLAETAPAGRPSWTRVVLDRACPSPHSPSGATLEDSAISFPRRFPLLSSQFSFFSQISRNLGSWNGVENSVFLASSFLVHVFYLTCFPSYMFGICN